MDFTLWICTTLRLKSGVAKAKSKVFVTEVEARRYSDQFYQDFQKTESVSCSVDSFTITINLENNLTEPTK